MNLLLMIVYLLVSIFLYLYSPIFIDKNYLVVILSLVCLSVISFSNCFYKLNKKNLFKCSFLFLVSFLICSFQIAVDFILDLNTENFYSVFFNEKVTLKCLTLSLVGFNAFILGYKFIPLCWKKNRIYERSFNNKIYKIFVIITYLFFFLFLTNVGGEYLSGVYQGNANWGTFSGWFYMFFEVSLICSFAYKIYNDKGKVETFIGYLKYLGKPIVAILLGFTFMNIYIGERGAVLSFLLILLYGYQLISVKKISILRFLLLGILLVGLLNVMKIIRVTDVENKDDSRLELLKEHENTSSISPYTVELSSSILPLVVATTYIPEYEDYKYGLFQLNQIMISFPGFFGLYFNLLGFDTTNDVNMFDSASYLTDKYLGKDAGWGIGSNCIADFYLDFGLIGVILGMFLWGNYVRKIDSLDYKTLNGISIYSFVFRLIFFSSALYLPRSTILFPIKQCIYASLIMFIIFLFFNNKKI